MPGADVQCTIGGVRLLFTSWPGYGHLLPMAPMVRAAQAAGHDVLVSSGADLADLIGGLGAQAHQSGLTQADSYARMPDRAVISGLPPEQQTGFAARHLFGAGAVDRARDLLDLMGAWRPDLVIHDTLELGAPVAAEALGVRHLTHGYGPMVPGTTELAAAVFVAITDAGFPDPGPAVFAAPYLDICPPGLRGTAPSPWPSMQPLRPTPGITSGTELPAVIDELPHQETVYVTLGTVMNQAPEVFRAVLAGASRLPVNIVATTGPTLDPDVLGAQPEHVVVKPYLPQSLLLPRCTAVISHAGAGTLLGALCHGLPQLCLPQGTDQPFNTAAVLPTGAALSLDPAEITPDAVEGALTRLLREPSFRDAAQRLQSEIERMPDATTVLTTLLDGPS